MTRPEDYRQMAADAVRLASRTSDPNYKAKLVEMANSWLHLADQAEKNSHADLSYETPPAPRATKD